MMEEKDTELRVAAAWVLYVMSGISKSGYSPSLSERDAALEALQRALHDKEPDPERKRLFNCSATVRVSVFLQRPISARDGKEARRIFRDGVACNHFDYRTQEDLGEDAEIITDIQVTELKDE